MPLMGVGQDIFHFARDIACGMEYLSIESMCLWLNLADNSCLNVTAVHLLFAAI
jgi:hypothetical protein